MDVKHGALKARFHQAFRPTSAAAEKMTKSASAIFPWMVGDEQAAIDLSRALLDEGFLAAAIRYPTVAKGAARLRITGEYRIYSKRRHPFKLS